MLPRLVVVLTLLSVAGCGDDTTSAANRADLSVAAAPDMALLSRCGHPGDVGNALGVGKFCSNDGPDCSGNSMAKSCSALFNSQPPSPSDTYFCSFQCQMSDPPGVCGDNATCLCNSLGVCACIPDACVPPDGGA